MPPAVLLPAPGAVTATWRVAPAAGIASFWPSRTVIVSGRPFAAASAWIETPYLRAIDHAVSPATTVWLAAAACGAGAVGG